MVGVVVVVVCAAVQVGWRGVPRRNWPGGGNGTDSSGGIASPPQLFLGSWPPILPLGSVEFDISQRQIVTVKFIL